MLRVIAIDDEPLALRQLGSYISRVEGLECVGLYRSAVDAREFLRRESVDLILCDIEMAEMNGVEFVRSLSEVVEGSESLPMVIFTTAYSEYAVEGFRLEAVDYLLKPIPFKDFERAVKRAQSLHALRTIASKSLSDGVVEEDQESGEYISVKADYKVTMVKVSDIIYLESEGEYVRLHLTSGRPLTTLFRLKNMETLLPSSTFVRTHRCYIVNINQVERYDRTRAYISEDYYLPIGLSYRESFQTAMNSRLL